MSEQVLGWVGFHLFIFVLLAIDLNIAGRKSREMNLKEALGWSATWIMVGLLFNVFIYFWRGTEPAMNFLAGFLMEKSLSVDNLFVFVLIFSYFKVPALYQRKVLFWGILGALIMRATFIVLGVQILNYFSWVMYIFGGFLIFTAIKLIKDEEDDEFDPSQSPVLKLFRKVFPIKAEYGVGKFLVKEGGVWYATQLLVVLVIIETTDVLFAVDSVPAVLGIINPPNTFIAYTSNIMAILGLRALYFALAGIMGMFHYLSYGLSAILGFIGIKMVISKFYHIPTSIALTVVASILAISVIVSIIFKPEEEEDKEKEEKAVEAGK
jgi:tellurite resistance protein TerC